MPKKPTYIQLPIYSVTAFKNIIYFSGGGGGKTGIPNEIFIFQGRVTPQPAKRIETGSKIIQNMTTNGHDELLICSANQYIMIYRILDKGLSLTLVHQFQADFSFKNPTINCIYMHPKNNIFVTGGDDKIFRAYAYALKQQDKAQTALIWSHQQHQNPLRNIDGAAQSFYLSTDNEKIVICDLNKKSILRKIFNDCVNPLGSVFQSAYFDTFSSRNASMQPPLILMCHYIPRSSAFITKQLPNKMFQTLEVSKDQSCLTARNHKYIGIASGNGTTFIIDPKQMKCIGEAKGHNFVITAATMTRGLKFITGTPECSYYLQQPQESFTNHILTIFFIILTILFFNYTELALTNLDGDL